MCRRHLHTGNNCYHRPRKRQRKVFEKYGAINKLLVRKLNHSCGLFQMLLLISFTLPTHTLSRKLYENVTESIT